MDNVHHAHNQIADYKRLRDDIAYLEARLTEIGHDGDCAYEKAMIRFFEQQLAERRAKLSS
jgi:hypothetical protein